MITGLAEGKTYTLSFAAGSISGFSDNPAPEISLKFSTKEPQSEPEPEPEPEPGTDYDRDPVTSPCNPNATQQAKNLYEYLLSIYGRKTLSGAMGSSAWTTEFTDYINSFSGKYPAILGFDYIHLEWSPADWIDYSDISAVKAAWEAHNIIQIGWHWCVPSKEGETDPSKFNFYSEKTTFDITKALQEGTWQHNLIDSQIAKLASYLQLLQAEGIPVLFRPLHEAAGDYIWGPWFWWGEGGAAACKQLWKYLYDSLTETYGLNNLLWVWTAQTSREGKTADVSYLEQWYPGDDCVDIVGADLYVDSKSSQSAQFKLVNNSVKGKKMVALSECGRLLDWDKAYSENAPWLYFMGWGDTVPLSESTNNWNTETGWKTALSNAYVLNRDDIPDLSSGSSPVPAQWQDAKDAVKAMKYGWNLGNTLDSWGEDSDWIRKSTEGKPSDWETAWGQPVTTPALIGMFADKGFGAIRVPVTWYEHLDSEGAINEEWMSRVEEIVNYVLDAGMYCIINMHHDTGTKGWLQATTKNYNTNSALYKKVWRQIAQRFEPYGEKLLFEGFNEMLDASASNCWNAASSASLAAIDNYNQDFVNAVRATGGGNFKRNLIVNSYAASAESFSVDKMKMPKDVVSGHLIAEAHTYSPYNFAMAEGEWAQKTFDEAAETEVISKIEHLNKIFRENGYPCIIGEYGCTAARAETEMAKQASCYVGTAAKYGIACFYWMTLVDGQDRTDLKWTKPAVRDAIIQAYNDNAI